MEGYGAISIRPPPFPKLISSFPEKAEQAKQRNRGGGIEKEGEVSLLTDRQARGKRPFERG